MRIQTMPVAAAIALVLAAAPAAATQYTYLFDSHYGGKTLGTGQLTGTAGTGTNPDGVTITGATAYTAVKSGTNVAISQSSYYLYDGGLGIVSSLYDNYNNCGTGNCGMHQVDNVGNMAGSTAYDFIQLTFSKAVTLVGMSRYAFGQGSGSSLVYDDDASYGSAATLAATALNKSAPAALGSIASGTTYNTTWSNLTAMMNNELGSGSGNAAVGGCNPTATMDGAKVCYDTNSWGKTSNLYTASNTWWISASLLNPDNKPDAFKLYDFTVVYNDTPGVVPEPASWMTMIAGFGFVGAGLRRRKATARLAAA